MSQIDKDRFFEMATCYDRMAPYLVPQYDYLQNQVIDLMFGDGEEQKLVVDLGAGSGIFLDRILSSFPGSRGVWIDYSDDFRRVAQQRLARYGSRVQFITSPLEEAWETQLDQPADAIGSMSAIHHLESAEKRRLYQRCHEALCPGGWFFNIDEMTTLYDDAYRNSLLYWVRHVQKTAPRVPAELQEYCQAWCERFDNWRRRNVDQPDGPKLRGDDIHEGYIQQMTWLREAGFHEVDLFVKFHLWSIIGGRKPAREPAT